MASSKLPIYMALAANLAIAVTKFIAAAITGKQGEAVAWAVQSTSDYKSFSRLALQVLLGFWMFTNFLGELSCLLAIAQNGAKLDLVQVGLPVAAVASDQARKPRAMTHFTS